MAKNKCTTRCKDCLHFQKGMCCHDKAKIKTGKNIFFPYDYQPQEIKRCFSYCKKPERKPDDEFFGWSHL